MNLGQRVAAITGNLKKRRDDLIKLEPLARRLLAGRLAHIDAAAFAKLDPAALGQIAISGADGVGMNLKTLRQLARARQALAGLEVKADDAEQYLRRELLAQRHVAVLR